MEKKSIFIVVILSLVLIESANAHKQNVHQHITREAFKLLQMSFPRQLSEMSFYFDNLATITSPNNLSLKILKYQNNIGLKNYMQNNWLLLKNNSETIENGSSRICMGKSQTSIYKSYLIGGLSSVLFSENSSKNGSNYL